MPGLLSTTAARLSLFIAALIAASGCAHAPVKSSSAGLDSTNFSALGTYRESTTDVINRAPQSMSVPSDDAQGKANGKTQARSAADYHFALAETYSLEGNTPRAIEEYKLTLIYDDASAVVHTRLAAEYVKQGLIGEAIEQAKTGLEKNPNYVESRLLLGGLYSALRMYEDALKEYQAVLKINPSSHEAPLYIGALLAEQKKFGEAAAQFEKIGKSGAGPNAHVAWYYLGRIRLEENREKNASAAEKAFEKALAVRPSYTDATLALGQLYEITSRKDRASRLYQAFQEKFGPNPNIAEELSRIYIEAKDYRRAFEQLVIIEQSEPGDINVKSKMAFILIEQKRYPEAIQRLEEILAQEPTSDKIRFYLGAVYEEVKDFRSAITHFKKVPLGSSYFAEAVVHTSYLYKLLGDYGRAIETVQAGIRAKDDHAQFYALYASLLDDQKQYRRAADILVDAVKKFPENSQLHFYLGNMQDRIGNRAGSMASMEKVLTLDADHVQALNFLAYTYAESGKNLDEAERLVRRALELEPNDGYILDTLGWVLFKRGKLPEAVRILEAAYKVQPNEAVIAEHLGDAYYSMQMPEKARKLYLRAAESETNVAVVEKIRAKIAAVERQIQTLGGDDRKPASAKAP